MGKEIAKVTQPISVDRRGVLLVAVTTNAWMNELAMMEPELLRVINEESGANEGGAHPVAACALSDCAVVT